MATAVRTVTAGNSGILVAYGYATSDSVIYGPASFGSIDSRDLFGVNICACNTGNADPAGTFVVEVDDIVTQDFFTTVQWTDKNGISRTLATADASVFNDGGGIGHCYWTWALGGAASDYITSGQQYVFTFTKADMPTITQNTPTVVASTDVEVSWTSNTQSQGVFLSFDVYRNGVKYIADIDADVTGVIDQTDSPNTSYTYEIQGQFQYSNNAVVTVTSNDETITTGTLAGEFNFDCSITPSYATLAALRKRMMIRLGYAAMANTPPPGMVDFCNEYLLNAQKQLWNKYKALHNERFFVWTMKPGVRYYAIADAEGSCDNSVLDPKRITWVGFEDLNKAWYELIAGIPPVYYTRANINFGWPTRYEVRAGIEVFPAPQAPYKLWVKGHQGLMPFTQDTDITSIDDELVLMFAVANAKNDKNQPGASVAMSQATNRLRDLTAQNHLTRRYVPQTLIQNPATPPKFLPLGNNQA